MIILLIIFFVVLIILACSQNNIMEGLTNGANGQYQNYNTNDPQNALILSQQNAGNIGYLKDRIDDIQDLNSTVEDLKKTVATLQTQVNGLIASQQQYVTQMGGNTTPNNKNSNT